MSGDYSIPCPEKSADVRLPPVAAALYPGPNRPSPATLTASTVWRCSASTSTCSLTWLIVGRLGCWGLVVVGITGAAWVGVRTNVGVRVHTFARSGRRRGPVRCRSSTLARPMMTLSWRCSRRSPGNGSTQASSASTCRA